MLSISGSPISNTLNSLANSNSIELSSNLTGNRNSFIDLHGDDTYTDYGLRLIRLSGTSGSGTISYNGTGALQLKTVQSGTGISIYTANQSLPNFVFGDANSYFYQVYDLSSTSGSSNTDYKFDFRSDVSLDNTYTVGVGLNNEATINNKDTLSVTQYKSAIRNLLYVNYTNNQIYHSQSYGAQNLINVPSTGGNSNAYYSDLFASYNNVDIGSTGSTYKYFRSAYGTYSRVNLSGSTATILNSYGIYASVVTNTGCASNSVYGLYIDFNLAGGSVSSEYGVYVNEICNNYFKGSLQIGGTASGPTSGAAGLGVGTTPSGVAGSIRATDDILAYYTSDQRHKENIEQIKSPLEKLNEIRGVYFDWTDDYINNHGGIDNYFMRKHDVGVIAQEVEKVLPEIVGTKEDGTKAVKYEKIVPLLIEAIKEQNMIIKSLTSRISLLEQNGRIINAKI